MTIKKVRGNGKCGGVLLLASGKAESDLETILHSSIDLDCLQSNRALYVSSVETIDEVAWLVKELRFRVTSGFYDLSPSNAARLPPPSLSRIVLATFTATARVAQSFVIFKLIRLFWEPTILVCGSFAAAGWGCSQVLSCSIVLPHTSGFTRIFTESYLLEISPISREMMFQPLSMPLQHYIRFLSHLLPADHLSIVTFSSPSSFRGQEAYGFTKFRKCDKPRQVATCLTQYECRGILNKMDDSRKKMLRESYFLIQIDLIW